MSYAFEEPLRGGAATEGDRLTRASTSYNPHSERFLVKDKTFDVQFSKIYLKRLELLSGVVWEAIDKRWAELDPKPKKANKILELSSQEPGSECIIAGVVLKQMTLRPDVLKDIAADIGLLVPPEGAFASEEGDSLVIEDDSGRVELTAQNDIVSRLCTGLVCGVRGIVGESGDFEILEIISSGAPALLPRAVPMDVDGEEKEKVQYVCFISDLGFGSENDGPALAASRQLVIDYLTASIGSSDERKAAGGVSIVRAVIAGGCVRQSDVEDTSAFNYDRQKARLRAARAVAPITDFDMFLTQLVSTLPVTVLPGRDDPTTHALPQKALHPSLLPGAYRHTTLDLASNPVAFECGGVEFIGTGGQNVADVLNCTRGLSSLDGMELTLTNRHLAPTAPDTLSCFPFEHDDPFILSHSPHVLFTGCQKEYAAKVLDGVHMVSVPSFLQQQSVVLLNLNTLETREVTFGVEL